MKLSLISSFALCASLAAAADLNVASVISAFYPSSTPHISPAASTSLASALNSVQSTWTNAPIYTSALSAIYSAAPSSAKSSIDASGFRYDDLTRADWYSKSVPGSAQTAVRNQIAAIDSAAAKVVGTPSSSANAAGPMRTAAPVVVGAVGLVLGAFL